MLISLTHVPSDDTERKNFRSYFATSHQGETSGTLEINISHSLFQLAQQTFQIFQKLLKVTYVRNPAPPGVKGLQGVKINLALCASAAVHLDRPRSTDGRREEEGREGQVLITYLIPTLASASPTPVIHRTQSSSSCHPHPLLTFCFWGSLKKFNESVKFPLYLKT